MIGPATLAGTTATFPITGGKAALDLSAATVRHSGGISLTKGATVVNLTDFDIVVGKGDPQLFASLNGGAEKVAIIDLDLSALQPAIDGRNVTLSGITAKLTQGAADALNAAFGTTAFCGRAGPRAGDRERRRQVAPAGHPRPGASFPPSVWNRRPGACVHRAPLPFALGLAAVGDVVDQPVLLRLLRR